MGEAQLTESVHLNEPQNMRESVVVTRRFLHRSEFKKLLASSLGMSLLLFIVSMLIISYSPEPLDWCNVGGL